MQNTQLIGTLLMCIAEQFSKLLQAIEAEAVTDEATGRTKSFQMGDVTAETSHLYTGGVGCPGASSVELEAQEWRPLAKKVVKAEVLGTANKSRFLVALINGMDARQRL
ncbi:hypothetical protein B0A49_05091 [Cryomyces minteri]|uniref:Uncharacterized protein n=1 Tax=Cryomyces minteri TaxID=331657 RepID=A0A4U0XEM2_9PEZI|nr:hypothetical protein B0A49_05091 [Cryomyces minteri]